MARSAGRTGLGGAERATTTVRRGLGEGGNHLLAAELLLFAGIVAIRAVAQYGPGTKKDLPKDQFGPLFILGNGLAVFFVLSFVAVKGGRWATFAATFGALVDLALLMKSVPHIDSLAAEYAAPRHYTPANLSGTYALKEAPVLSPALQFEVDQRQLPPQPQGTSVSKSMGYARKLLPHYGLKISEFPLLVKLWNQESGWRVNATNPSSGAYGIAQALPADKYASAGSDWKTSPYTQIRWGLQYIQQRYGSIAAAWDHEVHMGWY